MKDNNTALQKNSKADAEQVPQTAGINSSKTISSTAGTEDHMIPGKMYFDIIDPKTGRFIGPDNPQYFPLKRQFGGDAGTIDPYKSTACASIIEEWRKKQATKH